MRYNFKKNNEKDLSGFTLIEVLIVIAIIGIMASVILVFIGQSKHSTQLETAANEVVAGLRRIQNYSLVGKAIKDNCSDYAFETTNGSTQFSIKNGIFSSGGAGGNSFDPDSCELSQVFNLKGGVTFGDDYLIAFRAPFADVLGLSGTKEDIVLSKNGQQYHICITSVGVITMQKNPCS